MAEFFQTLTFEAQAVLLVGSLLLTSYVISHTLDDDSDVKAPWAFTYLKYCPRFLSNALYAWDTVGIVGNGYRKVCCFYQNWQAVLRR